MQSITHDEGFLDVATKKITGRLQVWDLSGEVSQGRKYININVNFGLLRQFFEPVPYDVFTGQGEQRIATKKRTNKLRKAFSDSEYTPTVFNACVTSLDQVEVDGREVTITLDDTEKLPLLDGNGRLAALLEIGGDKAETARTVDNQPIPLMIYLEPDKRKDDFINLNVGVNVHKSHLLSMQLDGGRLSDDKQYVYFEARELAKLLHLQPAGPFFDLVSFGAEESGVLALHVLTTHRKSNLICSLFSTAKILQAASLDREYFVETLKWLWELIQKKTECATKGKLLCIPPNGPKGAASLLVGAANVWTYYLYVNNRTVPNKKDLTALRGSLEVFNDEVNKELSEQRRRLLMQAFTQNLFHEIAEDPESPVGMHFGIPISLLVVSSASSFGVEAPPLPLAEAAPKEPKERKPRGRKPKPPVATKTDDLSLETTVVDTYGVDSDTDDSFND